MRPCRWRRCLDIQPNCEVQAGGAGNFFETLKFHGVAWWKNILGILRYHLGKMEVGAGWYFFRKIDQHKNADRANIDEGVLLLKLAQKAAGLYSKQSMDEKRRLLNFVHSNSSWKDGELTPNYLKLSDLLVVSNKNYNEKKTASQGKLPFWCLAPHRERT